MTITNSTFLFNSATNSGGAINNFGTLTLSNSTFYHNSSLGTYGGGAIDNGGLLTTANSTIFDNSAANGLAGGILNFNNGSFSILSTIVAGNTAMSDPDINGSAISLGNNLIGDGTGSTGFTNGINNDEVGTTISPIDAKLGTLASNGGVTQTITLLIGSPAIENGDCNGNSHANPPAPTVIFDQRGIHRKIVCDIGSFEYIAAKIDTIGIYRGGSFYLRLHNTQGYADTVVAFNPPGHNLPIVGDWTGAGFDTIGVYDQAAGNFYLRNSNTAGTPDESFTFGNPNDTPFSGRWLVSAITAGVGVYRPTNGILCLKNALTSGFADYAEVLGVPGDQGLAGDWTGKGFDSPGVYRPSGITFYLSNQVTSGIVNADLTATYGNPGDVSITGDWIAQGHDGIGLFRPTNGYTYLRNSVSGGYADNAFNYGAASDLPVAGHWQLTYPSSVPRVSPPIAITRTATPNYNLNGGSAPGGNQIGG